MRGDIGFFGLNEDVEELISKLIIEFRNLGWKIADSQRGTQEPHIRCLFLDYLSNPKSIIFDEIVKKIQEKNFDKFEIDVVDNIRKPENNFNLPERFNDKYDIIYINFPFGHPTTQLGLRINRNIGTNRTSFEMDFIDFIRKHLDENGRLIVLQPAIFLSDMQKSNTNLFKMIESVVDIGGVSPNTNVNYNLIMFQVNRLKDIDIWKKENFLKQLETGELKSELKLNKREFVSVPFHLTTQVLRGEFGDSVLLLEISKSWGKINLRDPKKMGVSYGRASISKKMDDIGAANLRKRTKRLKEEKKKLKELKNAIFIPTRFGNSKVECDKEKLRAWEYWYFELDEEKMNNKWLSYFLTEEQVCRDYLTSLMTGVTILNLSRKNISEMVVPIRGITEQEETLSTLALLNDYEEKIKTRKQELSIFNKTVSVLEDLDEMEENLTQLELKNFYEHKMEETEGIEFKSSLLVSVKGPYTVKPKKKEEYPKLSHEVVRAIAGMANRKTMDHGVVIVGLMEKKISKTGKNEILGLEYDFLNKIQNKDDWELHLRSTLKGILKDDFYINQLDIEWMKINNLTLCRISCPTIKYIREKQGIPKQRFIFVHGKNDKKEFWMRDGPQTKRIEDIEATSNYMTSYDLE
tara:strand:- start:1267 stop:3171 length:1905 start_codon:yes stop_codon:yes gene_type:complete